MTDSVVDRIVLGVLVFDGFLTAILAVLFLPAYIGSTAFPISAAAAALINIALVYGASTVTVRNVPTALPLIAWGFGFLLCLGTGPGGDRMSGRRGRHCCYSCWASCHPHMPCIESN